MEINKEQNQNHPQKLEFIFECIKNVDVFKKGGCYKAEEDLFGSPPSAWKQHLPKEQRGEEEFYDCFRVFEEKLNTSRGFTKAVYKNFFIIKEQIN